MNFTIRISHFYIQVIECVLTFISIGFKPNKGYRYMFKIFFGISIATVIFLTIGTSNIRASEIVWSQSSTSDCSHKGGTNGDFSHICFNTIGTNSDIIWGLNGTIQPAIRIPVITGHHYIFSYTTPFSYGVTSGQYDIIINFLSDGANQYILGFRSDWLYAGDGYHDGKLNYPLTATSDALYFLWGGGCDSSTGCYAENLTLTDLDVTSTPTPTPTSSPSPTIQPPTPTVIPSPTPITKVFLIPGMGASWNLDAFTSCKQSGYSGDWTMAPYAKGIYGLTQTSLENSGWNTIPFYYDWRLDIRDNGIKLSNLINESSQSNEKINIVGHSMGGLVGRSYVEQYSGGKTNKFLAVGAPNQGSALAYPALINGQIWTNDLIERIGATLFLKHCGKVWSFQNVIPTYDYLRDWNTQVLKPITSSKTKNNYLPTNFVAPFWGVKVGTIAGNSFPTLKVIDVVNDPKWPDGKPVEKEYSMEGDGTVLTQSVQIPDAISNTVINQTHSGIIGSTEGVNKILEFLGSPGVNDPPYTEPISALVIIGGPGNFWVTDKDGSVTQSDQGMVAIINPKDGDYTLQTIPIGTTSNFVVSKFMPDGSTIYGEYVYKGIVQKPKVIKFNSSKKEKGDDYETENKPSDDYKLRNKIFINKN